MSVAGTATTNLAHRARQPTRSIRSNPSSLVVEPTRLPAKQPTLAKRLLFPLLPPDASLPPLLITPSAHSELNSELYDFIAIALRAHVNPWWTKITRYDKEFLPHITRILTDVVRVLETRLISTDLSPLVFRDLPAILNQHCIDYRNARSKLLTSYASGGTASLPLLFHQMQSHMAISPEGVVNEEYVRQAVDNILKTCLPSEDYEPEPERFIIREIVVKILAGGVIPRVTQPWFIFKLMLDFLGPESSDDPAPPDVQPTSPDNDSRPTITRATSGHLSFQTIAIFVLSAVRSISGICLTLIHAYKQALETIKKVNESKPLFPQSIPIRPDPFGLGDIKEESSQSTNPVFPGTLDPSTPLPSGTIPPSPPHTRTSSMVSSLQSLPPVVPPPPSPPPPNYTHASLQLISTLLAPPLPSLTSPLTQYSNSVSLALRHVLSMILNLLSPFLSRLLPYLLYTRVFSSNMLCVMVKSARKALFPEGWPAPPPVDPTPEEQIELRKKLERRLQTFIPGPLTHLLGPTPAAVSYTISSMLDPLSSQACNAHLFVFVLDLVLVTVFPEMGVMVEGPVGASDNGSMLSRREGEMTPPRPNSRPP
ncbi:PXA domain-containing protein [Cristinia sonorae]|uniref:PXA domain-containing protein n=1 Tax=Cristinia sonorae TaxID=1940300 RepID=A0A8K0UNJ6_9AGAR|nr:PXA domain-containing protein [Cristinia sonorae]